MGSDPPRFNLPISCAALARSFSSLTSIPSSSSISLRQSAMSFMASTPRRGSAARGPERLYPFAHCLCRAPRIFFDQPHDRAAYHRSIRKLAYLVELVGRGNAKSHGDRQFRIFFDLFHQRSSISREFCPRARDSGPGHGIDKAGTCLGDLLESSIRAGGCGKEDGCQPVLMHKKTVVAGFFQGEVCNQSAIHPSGFCISGKLFQSVAKNGIQIRKYDQSRLWPHFANLRRESQYVSQSGAVAKRSFAGTLDDRAIGQRVTEGNAEFDDVRARIY